MASESPSLEPTGAWAPADAAAGNLIAGRYKLLEKIGEGGMGEVWVAEQTQPVRRKVALKLVKAGMDSKMVLSRFEAERQALALMEVDENPRPNWIIWRSARLSGPSSNARCEGQKKANTVRPPR